MARKSSSGNPQTGPLTAAGKERSSANSITHGGRCAQHRILPGEDPDEYRAIHKRWFGEYKPTSDVDIAMLERVVNAEWRMLRCERQLVQVETHLGDKPLWEYSDDDEKLMLRARRYHREAQRLYTAARRDLDGMRLTRHREMIVAVQSARALGQLPAQNPTDPELTLKGVVRPADVDFENPKPRNYGLTDPLAGAPDNATPEQPK